MLAGILVTAATAAAVYGLVLFALAFAKMAGARRSRRHHLQGDHGGMRRSREPCKTAEQKHSEGKRGVKKAVGFFGIAALGIVLLVLV